MGTEDQLNGHENQVNGQKVKAIILLGTKYGEGFGAQVEVKLAQEDGTDANMFLLYFDRHFGWQPNLSRHHYDPILVRKVGELEAIVKVARSIASRKHPKG